MRILCVIDSLGSGGAQRQLVELALGFRDSGHEVSFLTYFPDTFYISSLSNAGIAIKCLKSDTYIQRLIKMIRFIRQGRFHTVISFLETPSFICEIAGFPYRKWNLIVGERSANPQILKSFKLMSYRWFHQCADYVVANSHANMRLVKSVNPLLSASKCRIIYNIVDFTQWNPSADYVPRKNGKLKLVVAASHQKLKNLNGLLMAISLLTQYERSLIEVEWYGDRITAPTSNDSFAEAQKYITQYQLDDVITFYPATKELNQKFRQADVIGLFSFYEGFPNVVCEGMACAKPVICSTISDITSILSYDEQLMFQPENIESIRNTLSYVIGLTNQQLFSIGQINEKIAKDNFNKEVIVHKYLDLMGL